jgi:small conductance mechanosensitive channel
VSITNRNIDQIINLSDWLDIDIPVPYEKNVDYMKKVFSNIISEIKKIKHVKDSDIQGINEFAASNIVYKIRIYCAPETFPITKRAALEIIKREFDKENISIPYQQISIHNV